MFRQKQVDRIVNSWKNLDTAKTRDDYEKAWAIVIAADRNASADEKNAAMKVVSRAPWMKRK